MPTFFGNCLDKMTFSEYCIEIESVKDSCGLEGHFSDTDIRGGKISLNHNGLSKAIVPAGFEHFKYCFKTDDVDLANDEFQLQLLADDGVYDSVIQEVLISYRYIIVYFRFASVIFG